VVDEIRRRGDRALFAFTKRFDGRTITATTVRLSPSYIAERGRMAPAKLKSTIRAARARITAYHKRQKPAGFSMKTAEGRLSQQYRPLDRVGVYVPGGYTSYPSSVLMNVIPARIAGVREIAVVTPPHAELDPAVAYALDLLKVDEVYQVGGAQAVAALAYGTESIPAVDKIVGPGGAYVATAKRRVYGVVDIDSVAGPSEVVVLADESAEPRWVALDLLSQAEHGTGDEVALCVTENRAFAEAVGRAVGDEIARSPVRSTLERLPRHGIAVLVCGSREESIELVNRIAPEHLQIMTRSPRADLATVRSAAAVFLGPHTPVAMGDYFVGTNHVLPTGGGARFASPLGVESFMKRISVAEVSAAGLRGATPHVSRFARAEAFVHHALSVEVRVGREQ
jgi:histidinol dehydrogenase